MRYNRILLVFVALMIGVSMTAVTGTIPVEETENEVNGKVKLNHSPLHIDEFRTTSSEPNSINPSIVTTAKGIDRLGVDIVFGNLGKDDTLSLRPVMRNEADDAITVQLSTNTSENIEITGFNSTDVDPVLVTSIGEAPKVIEFELAEGQSGAVITVEYVVITKEAGGQLDVDIFLDVVG
jgi:hypothetical protein